MWRSWFVGVVLFRSLSCKCMFVSLCLLLCKICSFLLSRVVFCVVLVVLCYVCCLLFVCCVAANWCVRSSWFVCVLDRSCCLAVCSCRVLVWGGCVWFGVVLLSRVVVCCGAFLYVLCVLSVSYVVSYFCVFAVVVSFGLGCVLFLCCGLFVLCSLVVSFCVLVCCFYCLLFL